MGEKRAAGDGQVVVDKRARRDVPEVRGSCLVGDATGASPVDEGAPNVLDASLVVADAVVAASHAPGGSIGPGIGTLGDFTSIADDDIAAAAAVAAAAISPSAVDVKSTGVPMPGPAAVPAADAVLAPATIANQSPSLPPAHLSTPSLAAPGEAPGALASSSGPGQALANSGNTVSNLTGDASARVTTGAVPSLSVGPVSLEAGHSAHVVHPTVAAAAAPNIDAAVPPVGLANAASSDVGPSIPVSTRTLPNSSQKPVTGQEQSSRVAATKYPDNRVRRHICKTCGRGFLRTGDMNRHFATVHEKIRRAQCSICGGKVRKTLFISDPVFYPFSQFHFPDEALI